MKTKYLYRLWFPDLGYHGGCFDKISEATQREIEKAVGSGVIPVSISVDDSTSKTILNVGSSDSVEFDKESTQAFREWFSNLPFVKFGSTSVEVWRNLKEIE